MMETGKRLIDMEDALRRMEKAEHLMHYINGIKAVDVGAVRQFFGMLKPVDAVEVVHGRWIVRAEFNNGERVIAACSNCNDQGEVRTNRNEWGIWHIDSPYCPNCGAKMDGDGK